MPTEDELNAFALKYGPNAQNDGSNNKNNDDDANRNAPIDQLVTTIQSLLQQNTQMLQMLQLNSPNSNEVPNFNVMPDLSKTIDDFDGEKGPSNAKLWLQKVINTATLHKWPDAFTYQTAQIHMTGAAKHWLNSRSTEITNWKDLMDKFRGTFIFERSKAEFWTEMQQRTQNKTENVSSYFHEKVSLCRYLELSFMETKEQIAIGLTSRELSNFILSREHRNEDELYRDIINYERIIGVRKEKASTRTQDTITNKEKVPGRQPNVKSKPIRCFICQDEEHTVNNCRKPKRERGSCFTCGSMAHKYKDCPERKRDTTQQINIVQTPVVNPYTVSFKFDTICNDYDTVVTLVALLDTGSPVSLIKEKYVINFMPCDSIKHFVGINNSELKILGLFPQNITVNDDIQSFVEFYVVANETMSFPAILGRDFINVNKFYVLFSSTVEIKKTINVCDEINEIMSIDCINQPDTMSDSLNIGTVNYREQQDLKQLFLDKELLKNVIQNTVAQLYWFLRRTSNYECADWDEAELVSHIVERMTDQYCFAIAQANPRTMADLVALCGKWMDLFERKKPAAKPSGAAAPAGPPKTAGPTKSSGTGRATIQTTRTDNQAAGCSPKCAGSARDTISTETVHSSLKGSGTATQHRRPSRGKSKGPLNGKHGNGPRHHSSTNPDSHHPATISPVFKEGGTITTTSTTKHTIRLKDELPGRVQPYRYNPEKKRIISSQVAEMLAAGVIRASHSEYSSPVVIVTKKDGKPRFCVDYRRLNDKTRSEASPLPPIQESLRDLGRARIFSTLDLRSGYWQIQMDASSKQYAAFATPDFEAALTSLGPTKRILADPDGRQLQAPYSTGASRLLGLLWKRYNFRDFAIAYLDDIIIYSRDLPEHRRHLHQVLERLQQHGLRLNLEKCHFGSTQLDYLGHVVTKEGNQPQTGHVNAIKAAATPTTSPSVSS
ncbi:Retrotransposon gag protein [Popillia japonica]|uniref:Retrotransposon gag protein n=1 Tax=Popillia japonica TaxID=7064 RepID=A0AAW1KH19_POPJA